MTTVIAWLIRNPLPAILAAALLAASTTATVQTLRLASAERAADALRLQAAREHAQAAEALAAATERARAVEQRAVRDMAELDAHYRQELSNAQDTAARTIDDLHADRLRLRHSLAEACPSVPGSTVAAGRSDAATSAVVSRQAQERILQLGAEADELALQLSAAQSVIRDYYEMCGGMR